MSKCLNNVCISGNLARDPEVRYTSDKKPWARFTVAVGYSWKDKQGQYQSGANFVPVVVWGPMADNCVRYLKKGSPVLVRGRIKVKAFEAKDGSGKKYSTDIEADEVIFQSAGKRSEDAPAGASEPDTAFSSDDGGSEANIPF